MTGSLTEHIVDLLAKLSGLQLLRLQLALFQPLVWCVARPELYFEDPNSDT